MFDFARAYVVAIAVALARLQRGTDAGAEPRHVWDDPASWELPRFLSRPLLEHRPRALKRRLPPGSFEVAVLEAGRLARALMSEAKAHAVSLGRKQMRSAAGLWDAVRSGYAGLATILSIACIILLLLAGTAPGSSPRNPQADAIAARFAFASGGLDAAVLEERLDFAPRFAIALSARAAGVQIALAQTAPSSPLPFDALGAVVLRGLPDGASLSSGMNLGGGSWAVAQGDLDRLEVSLPNLSRPAGLQADVFGREGGLQGSLSFTLAPVAFAEARFDGASAIRTGALNQSPVRAPAALRPERPGSRVRRPQTASVHVRKPRKGNTLHSSPNVVKVQLKPVPTLDQAPGSPVLLFKPATDPVSQPVKPPQKPSFPRGAMEEEAARR